MPAQRQKNLWYLVILAHQEADDSEGIPTMIEAHEGFVKLRAPLNRRINGLGLKVKST